MAYQICKRCGKFFNRNARSYCEDCFKKTEEEYDLIIEYIRKYPDATILDIITATGVPLKSINCFVEDGYASYVDNKIKKIDEEEVYKVMDKIIGTKSKFHIKRD